MRSVGNRFWNRNYTPAEGDEHRAKLLNRKDRALATIVLAVEPSLLYLIGDPEDPIHGSVEEVTEPIPEEDLGEQVGTST